MTVTNHKILRNEFNKKGTEKKSILLKGKNKVETHLSLKQLLFKCLVLDAVLGVRNI